MNILDIKLITWLQTKFKDKQPTNLHKELLIKLSMQVSI